MADRNGTAGVGTYEFDLRRLAAANIELEEILAFGDDDINLTLEKLLRNVAIDKAGWQNLNFCHEAERRQVLYDQVCDLKRLSARALRQAHSGKCEVALSRSLWRADRDGRHFEHGQVTRRLSTFERGVDRPFKFPV